jgi:hypothetical protein
MWVDGFHRHAPAAVMVKDLFIRKYHNGAVREAHHENVLCQAVNWFDTQGSSDHIVYPFAKYDASSLKSVSWVPKSRAKYVLYPTD